MSDSNICSESPESSILLAKSSIDSPVIEDALIKSKTSVTSSSREVRFYNNPSPVSADKHTSPMELTNR